LNRRELKGTGASRGIAIGPARLLSRRGEPVKEPASSGPGSADAEGVAGEVQRLRAAVDKARAELSELAQKARGKVGPEGEALFEAHLLMLDDPELTGRAERLIQEENLMAESAVEAATREVCSRLTAVDDEYLRARADDVRDVGDRLVRILRGEPAGCLGALKEPVVVVAEELMPSDTLQVDVSKVLAFLTVRGSPTSHAAILARTLGIPAVVGAHGLTQAVEDGALVVADGETGVVIVNPTEDELRAWREKQRACKEQREALLASCRLPGQTSDGHRVEVATNIGSPDHVRESLENGAEGIGLFRTEFLFMDRSSPPDEDEQFEAYRAVVAAMEGRPVIVRTLDIGGDKKIPWLGELSEANPFLGLRGVRLTLEREDLLLTQLKAILRAAEFGDVRIMIPMVTDLTEVRRVRRVLRAAGEELKGRGRPPDEVQVGIMVEVPSAALLADEFLREVDFASVGTNDLTQYVLATDRTNEKVQSLADALHPAVLRLIKLVADAGHRLRKWVGVCGDLAGDPRAAPLLVGLGVSELSMAPRLIPEVKAVLRALCFDECRRLARRALSCSTAGEVRNLLPHPAPTAGPCRSSRG